MSFCFALCEESKGLLAEIVERGFFSVSGRFLILCRLLSLLVRDIDFLFLRRLECIYLLFYR